MRWINNTDGNILVQSSMRLSEIDILNSEPTNTPNNHYNLRTIWFLHFWRTTSQDLEKSPNFEGCILFIINLNRKLSIGYGRHKLCFRLTSQIFLICVFNTAMVFLLLENLWYHSQIIAILIFLTSQLLLIFSRWNTILHTHSRYLNIMYLFFNPTAGTSTSRIPTPGTPT